MRLLICSFHLGRRPSRQGRVGWPDECSLKGERGWRRGWDYSARSASPLRGRPPGVDAIRMLEASGHDKRVIARLDWPSPAGVIPPRRGSTPEPLCRDELLAPSN
jgi:hypothetical protein